MEHFEAVRGGREEVAVPRVPVSGGDPPGVPLPALVKAGADPDLLEASLPDDGEDLGLGDAPPPAVWDDHNYEDVLQSCECSIELECVCILYLLQVSPLVL